MLTLERASRGDVQRQGSEIRTTRDAESDVRQHAGPGDRGLVGQGGDAVEAALVRALDAATVAGRWDVVVELARVIEGRRRG
jgi:hypothetical protein